MTCIMDLAVVQIRALARREVHSLKLALMPHMAFDFPATSIRSPPSRAMA